MAFNVRISPNDVKLKKKAAIVYCLTPDSVCRRSRHGPNKRHRLEPFSVDVDLASKPADVTLTLTADNR